MPVPGADAQLPARYNPRWAVADLVSDALRDKYAAAVQAIGVHGSLAHGEDTEASDVHLVAVTRWPRAGPEPGTRRIDGVIIDVSVIGADEYLRHARTLTTSWPLAADRYITTKALHDPDAWLPQLRDAHLACLADADEGVFASLAREAWYKATSAQARAQRMVEWYQTDTAMLMLSEARLGVAVVEGLLTRTYFRNTSDAVRTACVASANIYELGERLAEQAEALARRGRSVDGEVADLVG